MKTKLTRYLTIPFLFVLSWVAVVSFVYWLILTFNLIRGLL